MGKGGHAVRVDERSKRVVATAEEAPDQPEHARKALVAAGPADAAREGDEQSRAADGTERVTNVKTLGDDQIR